MNSYSCPHGFFVADCPECSMTGNVKPLIKLDDKKFMEFSIKREADTIEGEKVPRAVSEGKIVNVDNLRPKRLVPDEKLRVQQPSATSHLRSRIAQLHGGDGPIMSSDMKDKVEKRVRQVRKHSLNPFVKDE